MDKNKAINILNRHLKLINTPTFKNFEFEQWKLDTQAAIRNIFGIDSIQLREFQKISYKCKRSEIKIVPNTNYVTAWNNPNILQKVTEFVDDLESGLKKAQILLKSFIYEIEQYWDDDEIQCDRNIFSSNNLHKIQLICNKFHQVVRQMRLRYRNRSTLEINDEYDVQDLFHSLLTVYFDDIRKEESNPSHAGSNSRADFLLKSERIVIEIKKTREGLKDKQLGEELTLDIQKYQAHPDCETLVCFVYDPEARINNPRGLEKDLEKTSDKIKVNVFIRQS